MIQQLLQKIFVLLGNVNSDVEDGIDEVLNYSDTEFYVEEKTYNFQLPTAHR